MTNAGCTGGCGFSLFASCSVLGLICLDLFALINLEWMLLMLIFALISSSVMDKEGILVALFRPLRCDASPFIDRVIADIIGYVTIDVSDIEKA